MSMNIELVATGIITLPNRKQKKIVESFEYICQTPTEVTYEIEDCATFEGKLKTYLQWVEKEMYQGDAKRHITLIKKWIKEKTEDGYNLSWEIV